MIYHLIRAEYEARGALHVPRSPADITLQTARRHLPGGAIGVDGRLTVRDGAGEVVATGANMVVYAGLEVLVAAMQSASYVNTYKYIAFGTGSGATTSGATALTAELSTGTYARLVGTQGSGATARVYRVTGTWTNNSTSDPANIGEYGLLSASTVGTLFARTAKADTSGPYVRAVGIGDTLTPTWDFTFADA